MQHYKKNAPITQNISVCVSPVCVTQSSQLNGVFSTIISIILTITHIFYTY